LNISELGFDDRWQQKKRLQVSSVLSPIDYFFIEQLPLFYRLILRLFRCASKFFMLADFITLSCITLLALISPFANKSNAHLNKA